LDSYHSRSCLNQQGISLPWKPKACITARETLHAPGLQCVYTPYACFRGTRYRIPFFRRLSALLFLPLLFPQNNTKQMSMILCYSHQTLKQCCCSKLVMLVPFVPCSPNSFPSPSKFYGQNSVNKFFFLNRRNGLEVNNWQEPDYTLELSGGFSD
jgi:hypothetical protein